MSDTHDGDLGELVPDKIVWAELNITRQTCHAWDGDPEMAALGWPPPVYVGNHKHRFRGQLNGFKQNLVAKAIRERNKRHEKAA